MIKNLIKITNRNNSFYNYENELSMSHTIIIKNCSKLSIYINDKINKVIIENSNDIFLELAHLIAGLEILKGNNIVLSLIPNYSIGMVEAFKSTIFLYGPINLYRDLKISCELSNIYNIE